MTSEDTALPGSARPSAATEASGPRREPAAAKASTASHARTATDASAATRASTSTRVSAAKSTQVEAAAATSPPLARSRLVGLDGIRGLAALFVVVNHIFLRSFPGYPVDHAPFWAGWFIYGRFAVVVFIVLSGFSLTVSPVRSGWRLGSKSRFAYRRAWRILPPYWSALVFSLLMTWFVVAQPGWAVPNGKSVVVYGLLIQDAVNAPIPNRAFWSIAIEAQLYIVLPPLLLIVRRFSAIAMVATVAAIVVTVGVLAPHVAVMNTALIRFTPDLAVLFAIGVMAAGIVDASQRRRSLPWHWFALVAAAPVVALIAVKGSVWTINNLFWVDLAWGPAIGCLLVAVVTDRPQPLVRFLDTRPLRSLGSFSYSLYLTHAPIVIAVSYGIVLGRVPTGVPAFLVLVAIVVPLTVAFARLFAAVFEIPFQRHRGWHALRRATADAWARKRPSRQRMDRPEPHVPASAGAALSRDRIDQRRRRQGHRSVEARCRRRPQFRRPTRARILTKDHPEAGRLVD
jgi:peptidoglycan/LPS O-acetylase OafA/YrhL